MGKRIDYVKFNINDISCATRWLLAPKNHRWKVRLFWELDRR